MPFFLIEKEGRKLTYEVMKSRLHFLFLPVSYAQDLD